MARKLKMNFAEVIKNQANNLIGMNLYVQNGVVLHFCSNSIYLAYKLAVRERENDVK